MQTTDRRARLERLREHLATGAEQAARGEFVAEFSTAELMRRAIGRTQAKTRP